MRDKIKKLKEKLQDQLLPETNENFPDHNSGWNEALNKFTRELDKLMALNFGDLKVGEYFKFVDATDTGVYQKITSTYFGPTSLYGCAPFLGVRTASCWWLIVRMKLIPSKFEPDENQQP